MITSKKGKDKGVYDVQYFFLLHLQGLKIDSLYALFR